MINRYKLIRIATVPVSLEKLLENQLHFMNSYYDVVAVSSDKKYLERVGSAQGVPVFHVEMTRKITPLKDIRAVWQLYKYFKKEKPFIVHSHTPKAGTVSMLAAKLAGVPHRLHTVAGLPLLEAVGLKRNLLNIVERATYHCATKVYPNSSGLKEIILKENFCSPLKVKVIGTGSSNGINTSHFSSEHFSAEDRRKLKQSIGISIDDFVFIFVGRLVADKGINELVSAFKVLSKDCKTVKLLLVGSLENELDPLNEETLQEISSNHSIIRVGYQSDVRSFFSISDCLVFPSYREGFPNVVMQAGAMGLPSIVTDINGCNEIIQEGINGTIIPVKNSAAIFEKMQKIMSDKDWKKVQQKNARHLIVSKFEQQVIWESILEEYKNLE